MPTYTEITPRELRPALLQLEGISRASIEAHYRLYQGYVAKRNEILGKLENVDRTSANQVYSELRALKVDLSFAIGGIKNHEIYFAHLGGEGGNPTGAIVAPVVRSRYAMNCDGAASIVGVAGTSPSRRMRASISPSGWPESSTTGARSVVVFSCRAAPGARGSNDVAALATVSPSSQRVRFALSRNATYGIPFIVAKAWRA